MSQNETITFTCQSCLIELQVPSSLAGVTGPCPNCQASITAPHPATVATANNPDSAETKHTASNQHESERNAVNPAYVPKAEAPQEIQADPAYKKTSESPKRRATQPSSTQDSHPVAKRKIWPTLLFPLLFLLLAAAVVYLILDLMGVWKFGEDDPKKVQDEIPNAEANSNVADRNLLPPPPVTANPSNDIQKATGLETTPAPDSSTTEPAVIDPNKALEHAPEDLQKEGEISGDLPEISQSALSSEEAIKKRTAAIRESRDVLKKFLDAQNFNERKSLITNSKRKDEELSSSFLNQPLPPSLEPRIHDSRQNPIDRSFEVFFSVAFEGPTETKPKIIIIRTVSYSEQEAAKIDIDPFVDLYSKDIATFFNKKSEGTGTFDSIVELSAYCFDDIPKATSMAKLTFFTNFAVSNSPIATAYLSKESASFKNLSKMVGDKKRFPATISVAWETESDPKRPFLEVIRVEEMNWNL